ncbi:MFS transporter [Halochromatium salexigens]|uniref:MFS transporter n=1 Tax=Halochromatium salexigens TaxID=49447 RepID=A0AAJ0UDX9_HALSE|nr:MFS transporter [Halochromatium salexigens]MBK5929664.1 MFS transporter [Halochromatium salexigens]
MSTSAPEATSAGVKDDARLSRIGPVALTPGVTRLNGYTFLLSAFLSIGLMTFITAGQTYILNAHLGVPQSAQGTLTGDLVFFTEIITLLLFMPAGILIDRISRRGVFAVGFLMLGATYVLYPLATGVEWLFASRVLYGIGVVAVAGALSTVLVDYPIERCRGKLVAMVGVLSGLGVVVMNQGFGSLPEVLTVRGFGPVEAGLLTHFGVAGLCVLGALAVRAGLRGGVPVHREERPSVRALLLSGFAQARNPRILLAYGAAFIARGDQSVNAAFLILWGTLAGRAAGMTDAEAVMNGTLIFVIAQISALVWAPVMGPILDRMDRVTGLAICMVLAAIGNLALILLADPYGDYRLVFFILQGIGQISVFLAAQSLIGQEAPRNQRGSVLSAFNISGALGILIITAIGGRLFDSVDPRAPFVVVGAVNLLLFLASLYVRLRTPRPPLRGQPATDSQSLSV